MCAPEYDGGLHTLAEHRTRLGVASFEPAFDSTSQARAGLVDVDGVGPCCVSVAGPCCVSVASP